jgi:ABC-type branched-subunit amino acid transport system substrate-binding protein
VKNKMSKQKHRGATILALLLIALLAASACAPAPSLQAERTVEIGLLGCLTGAGATAEHPCFLGVSDYVTYFNEEKGIPDVTIELVWRDTGTEVVRAITNYNVLADRGVPLIMCNDGRPVEALMSQLEQDRIPLFTGNTQTNFVYPPSWVFPAWATHAEAATLVFDYFMVNWKEERPPKLQFFIMDSLYGWDMVEDATRYAESLGFEVLPIEVGAHVIVDATIQMLRIREQGADLVYFQHIITGAGPAMRDAERLGLVGETQFASNADILGEALIEMVPVGVEGFLAPRALPWIDETEIPGVKTMLDKQMEFHGKIHEGPEYMAGWVYGAIMCEALERALDKAGYDNLDGPAVKRALESIQDFDVDGIVKITYGPEDRRGTRDFALYQVQGGKIVRITDYRETPILVP